MQILGVLTSAEKNAAVAGGVAGGIIGFAATFSLAMYILYVVALWRIFDKAGEAGWKSLIPLYNVYILYKIVGMKAWFWMLIVVSFVASIIVSASGINFASMTQEEINNFNLGQYPQVIFAYVFEVIFAFVAQVLFAVRTSRAFGHGAGFAVGLFFFSPLFMLILGFGKSKYDKKAIK